MSQLRRMNRRNARAKAWAGLFRKPEIDHYTGERIRRQGEPLNTKREAKRALLREAQKINRAIRTLSGAKKLDRRLTREEKERNTIEQRRAASGEGIEP